MQFIEKLERKILSSSLFNLAHHLFEKLINIMKEQVKSVKFCGIIYVNPVKSLGDLLYLRLKSYNNTTILLILLKLGVFSGKMELGS